jgi:hypothetical protein
MWRNKKQSIALTSAFLAGVALTYAGVAVVTQAQAQVGNESPQPPGGFGGPVGGGGFGGPGGGGGFPGGGQGRPMMQMPPMGGGGAPVMQVSGENVYILRGNNLFWYTTRSGKLALVSQADLPQPRGGFPGGGQPPVPPEPPAE